MGKAADRKYIRNFAKTLMGQLQITEGRIGVSNYPNDFISFRLRRDLVEKIFSDLRHLKLENLARLASCGIMGTYKGQKEAPGYEKLHEGVEPCTMCFVHDSDTKWITIKAIDGPESVIRYMAATAVAAAMYDIVVSKNKTQSVTA